MARPERAACHDRALADGRDGMVSMPHIKRGTAATTHVCIAGAAVGAGDAVRGRPRTLQSTHARAKFPALGAIDAFPFVCQVCRGREPTHAVSAGVRWGCFQCCAVQQAGARVGDADADTRRAAGRVRQLRRRR
eukprot:357218-Chlamydomonas_euryale.AAC.3